jgi:hypothetical protein
MKRKKTALILIAILVVPAAIIAEIVTASSEPFTFPEAGTIRQHQPIALNAVFSSNGYSASTRSLIIKWSVPLVDANNGTIVIYSLQGKAIKMFPLNSRSGSIIWKVPSSQAKSGILIARLTYGSHASTLKLVLCR